jgi:glutamate-1-semialdehyde 2,1-aminomutase
MKTRNSEAFFERAKRVAPGGVHSPVRSFRGVGGTPRFIERARGAELFDVDQNRYIDFCMSWGPLLFGHQDPDVSDAVQEALGRGWSFGTAEPYSLELAEIITSSIPWVEKVRFVNSGTEAVMSALRVARAVTGRNKILKFDGCYHGHVDSLLVKAGSGLADMASSDSAGVPAHVAQDTIVVPLHDRHAFELALQKHGKEIAAVAIEPLPANNGLLIQTDEYLKWVADRTRAVGALLLWDEVISGFRVAFGGMAEKTGVRPDLVCYGKVIGGGFPVGAYGGKAEYMDWVAPAGPVYQAGTLSGNPVAMCAGIAMLKKLKRLNPYALLAETTKNLTDRLAQVAHQEIGEQVRFQREGSIFWGVLGDIQTQDGVVRSLSQIPATQKERYSKVFHSMLNQGVYFAPSGFEVSFVSTAHEPAHMDQVVDAYRSALRSLSRET